MWLCYRDPQVTGWRISSPGDGSGCLECQRPAGHEGPCLVQRGEFWGNVYVTWELHLCEDCDCGAWESDDLMAGCVLLKVDVPESEVARYLSDPRYKGETD